LRDSFHNNTAVI